MQSCPGSLSLIAKIFIDTSAVSEGAGVLRQELCSSILPVVMGLFVEAWLFFVCGSIKVSSCMICLVIWDVRWSGLSFPHLINHVLHGGDFSGINSSLIQSHCLLDAFKSSRFLVVLLFTFSKIIPF